MKKNRLFYGLKNSVETRQRQRLGLFSGFLTAVVLSIVFLVSITNTETLDEVYFSMSSPKVLSVCGNSEDFLIEYINMSGFMLSNQNLKISFPTGIQYVPGSIQVLSGHQVSEKDISDKSHPVFSVPDLDNGASVEFSVQQIATKDAIAFVLDGNTARNEITLQSIEGVAEASSESYNIIYPLLKLIDFKGIVQYLTKGDTSSWSVNVVNVGYGNLSSFYITDLHEPGLDAISISTGTLNATQDTIFFGPSDFRQIGNGDDFFGESELLFVSKKFSISACTEEAITSVLNVEWGCENTLVRDVSAKLYAFIRQKTPSLSISTSANLSSCFASGEASPQQIVVSNQGDGLATDVLLDIFKSQGFGYDEDIYSRIDTGSITIQTGISAAATRLFPSSVLGTKNSGDYACLGSNPIGKASLDLPTIGPRDSLIIKWNTFNCKVNSCEGTINTGWEYDLKYQDVCGETLSENKDIGEIPKISELSIFSESPSDMGYNQKEVFLFTMSSFENTYPAGIGAHYEVNVEIPKELTWEDKQGDLLLKNGTEWTPYEVDFSPFSRTLTAKYALPSPIILHKAELFLWLRADSIYIGANDRSVSLKLNINYVPDTSCALVSPMPILCGKSVDVLLHGPQVCTEGMSFDGYEISRTSFGLPDNDEDGLPDSQGSLDMKSVRTNRAMVGDTIEAIFYGLSNTSFNNPSWSYGYAKSEIELGSNLNLLGAQVRVYDASKSAYISCDQVKVKGKVLGDDQIFTFDFSPSSIELSCGTFQGFTFGQGDSIWLKVQLSVGGNIEGNIQEIKIDNDFYLSNQENPEDSQQYQCSKWGDKLTLIGYYFKNERAQKITIDGCSKTIYQNFKLSIGTCCSNYESGELFPNEYRYWGHVKKAWTVIPANYEIGKIRVSQKRTRLTNSFVTESVENIQADSIVGDTLWFDLEQYFLPYGGSMNLSDEGFSGALEIELFPTCEVIIEEEQEMAWKFTFEESTNLAGVESDWYTSDPDKIIWSPPSLDLYTQNPTLDELSQTVSWSLEVTNTSKTTSAPNAWVHPEFPPSLVTLLYFIDERSGDTLSASGEFYQIGEIGIDSLRKFTLVASYNSCESALLDVQAGYGCSGYPDNLNDFKCQYSLIKLQVEPPPAKLFMTLIDSSKVPVCSAKEAMIEIEVSSGQMASIDSISFRLSFPKNGGLSFQAGSAELKYSNTASYVSLADPIIEDSTITMSLLKPFETGELGTDTWDKKTFRLRFKANIHSNYRSGDLIDMSVFSQEVCQRSLEILTMSYDPAFTFSRYALSGLMNDQGDSWSSAWGDYDKDGYDDLYVTEYDYKKGNYLYHNNGDGTFSKETTGPQRTDTGASAGSTWGDYDNDGDVDLFVSNTARASNHLYENKGEGIFERVNAGDLSAYGGRCQNAAWVDYDNDGWLDMFVSDYLQSNPNQLFHNNQDGTFTQIQNNPFNSESKYSLGASWADYDNDGLLDLFVPNGQNGNNSLYHNDGTGQFTRITSGYIVIDGGNSSGSAWGDYDNDGDFDLYVTNRSNQDNFFYINNGDGTFIKNTQSILTSFGGHSNGAAWGDVNNDGWLDLFVGNDAENLNHLFMNQGDGSFKKSENPINKDRENSMGAAFSDIDNDGDLDLFIANTVNKANTLYLNNGGNCNSWKAFKLEGTRSNRSAIGAKIRLKAKVYGEVMWQTREITAQSGGGTSSQSTLKAYFGLGDASFIDSVIIDWPSGITQFLTHLPTRNIQEVIERDLYERDDSAGLASGTMDNWSAAWGDYDDDGYEDLYVTEFKHWTGSYLYHNEGDGSFTQITSGAVVEDKGASSGSTWGDYDNDGDLDLFVSNKVHPINPLFQNQGNGTFLRIEGGDISSYGSYCHNAVWVDYDNDGWLDMFVSDLLATKNNQLHHNNGDGTFAQVVDNLIVTEASPSMGATWADYDHDGLMDLFVPNGAGENNALYHNDGNGKFSKITSGEIVNDGGNSVGSTWGDYDNDGDLDLYVSNTDGEYNFFYINEGDGTFTREINSLLTRYTGHSQGAGWADVNNDSYLDLFVANDNNEFNHLFMNQGDGTFMESKNEVSLDQENSKGAAFADIDNDGDLELFIANDGGQANALYKNMAGNSKNWKAFKLEGVASNRSAIGARVRIKAFIYGKEVWQTREVSAQSGGGSSSQSTLKTYFGLGNAKSIDSVIINWPSGSEQILTDIHINDIQKVVEAEGIEICGLVYDDANQNCRKDTDEAGIPNVILEILPGPKYVVTDLSGNYTINRQYGTYSIRVVPNEDWKHTSRCDTMHTVVHESANRSASLSFCGKDFSMEPAETQLDLTSYLASTALRRGFRNTYAVSYLNKGSFDAYGVELAVRFDNEIIPLSADIPWDQVIPDDSSTTYIWYLDSVLSREQTTILVRDSVSADARLGKVVAVSSTFRRLFNDANKANNSATDYNAIVGSVNSNSKEVFPTGVILPSDTLTYKIRFQNVGSSFSQQVLVRDTLSEYLDESSLKVIGASHPYQIQFDEGLVSFLFDRINLPDSNFNESQSHGFIQFKIVPKADTELGVEIQNRASIQFDYNEEVLTNFTYSRVENTAKLAQDNQLGLLISPNPLIDQSYVRVVGKEKPDVLVPIEKVEIFNKKGALVYSENNLYREVVAVPRNNLNAGIYFLRAYDENGYTHTGKLVVK